MFNSPDMVQATNDPFKIRFSRLPTELRTYVKKLLLQTNGRPIMAKLMRCSSDIQKQVAPRLYASLSLSEGNFKAVFYGRVRVNPIAREPPATRPSYMKKRWLKSTRMVKICDFRTMENISCCLKSRYDFLPNTTHLALTRDTVIGWESAGLERIEKIITSIKCIKLQSICIFLDDTKVGVNDNTAAVTAATISGSKTSNVVFTQELALRFLPWVHSGLIINDFTIHTSSATSIPYKIRIDRWQLDFVYPTTDNVNIASQLQDSIDYLKSRPHWQVQGRVTRTSSTYQVPT